jgi:ankyrin repeat protein
MVLPVIQSTASRTSKKNDLKGIQKSDWHPRRRITVLTEKSEALKRQLCPFYEARKSREKEEKRQERIFEQLIVACRMGDIGGVRMILNQYPHFASYFKPGFDTPLCEAAASGQGATVSVLLSEYRLDVNAPGNETGKTALHSVCMQPNLSREQVTIAEYLLLHGANVASRTHEPAFSTPLKQALSFIDARIPLDINRLCLLVLLVKNDALTHDSLDNPICRETYRDYINENLPEEQAQVVLHALGLSQPELPDALNYLNLIPSRSVFAY